eukprot:5142037-Prymnesium_polylepis.2
MPLVLPTAQMLASGRTRRWAAALEPPSLWPRGAAAADDTARAASRVASLLLGRADVLECEAVATVLARVRDRGVT